MTWFLVATPGYLKKHRHPRTPDDLKEHDCLLFGAGSPSVTVQLERADQSVQLPIAARLRVSDFEVLGTAALAGLGIALLPAFQCMDDLRAHRLERVLSDWAAPSIPVHVVYPTARHLSAKVKSFVEHLQQRMTPPPWELGPMP